MKYRNALEKCFEIKGVFFENGKFRRIPEELGLNVNDGIKHLHSNTAGGRVRFKTDSSCVAVKVKYGEVGMMNHFALTGSAGLDVYADKIYIGTFKPDRYHMEGLEGEITLPAGKKDILINMPTYSDVADLQIGLDDGAVIEKAESYINEKPVVFYGSSITQGGCCSRPGNSYQAIVSRKLDLDYINLGFSGSCKGEDNIVEYIAGLEMCCFVLDYDHNAPDPEHLRKTHYNVYDKVRKAHPDIPIIMMTRPKFHLSDEEEERLAIVKESYERALKAGDDKVYFISGKELIAPEFIETATVDNCHPNDSGFVSMAMRVEKELKKVLLDN